MRIDRYISQGTGTPRSHVWTGVRAGQALVNGVEVRDPAKQVTSGVDEVVFRGKPVRPFGHRVLMLHKPVGHVCTTEEMAAPNVMSLVPADLQARDLAPIGRLDKDTTGLLLLTTDGGLNHALTHPRRHVEKAYVATLQADLPPDAEDHFAVGIVLPDGTRCLPAVLERMGPKLVRIRLHEGKFHQVKRMVAVCGGLVLTLHRERIGGLWLDPNLPPGGVRELTADEVALLRSGEPADQGEADATEP
jgi:16S rRNA pseudouridine516 synthase